MAADRIVLTRQHERNREWALALRLANVPVLELPLIRFEPLPLPDGVAGQAWDWILFSSPQAVTAFTESDLARGTARMGALGSGTSAALASGGFTVDFDPGCRDGEEFAAAFIQANRGPANVLWPGPQKRLGEPLEILTRAGFAVTAPALYRTAPVPPDELPPSPWSPGDIVFFCSPSTVDAFSATWQERPACVAIGETTADAALAAGFAPRVAVAPDLASMVRAAGLDIDPVTSSPENMS